MDPNNARSMEGSLAPAGLAQEDREHQNSYRQVDEGREDVPMMCPRRSGRASVSSKYLMTNPIVVFVTE